MSDLKVIDTVKFSRLKRMVNSLELHNKEDVDMDISFEYIIASLFPSCYNNIQDELKRQYTLGYMQGIKESKENLKSE